MEPVSLNAGSAIARIIVARRAQIRARIAFAVFIVGAFHIYTGLAAAIAWAAVYLCLQLLEFFAFRRIAEDRADSTGRRNTRRRSCDEH
jgi:uncharacterized membrane protein YjfL (UPF0719 family)